MSPEEIKEPIQIKKCSNCKRCSDFDDECVFVKDKLGCWMGLTSTINGIKYETGRADGYCPYIHTDN